MLALLLLHFPGVRAAAAALDLNAWVKERPRIRELVARRTQANGSVNYLLLVADGSNYVVKMAPTEKLLRARVLTPEVDVTGRCGDELWVVRGRIPELRFLREKDRASGDTNFVGSTLTLNFGASRLGLAFLYFGTEPLPQQRQPLLTASGFEWRSRELTTQVAVEKCENQTDRLTYSLAGIMKGDRIGGGENKFRVCGELEAGSFIPLRYAVYDLNTPANALISTVERISLTLADSPLPLRLFRPEPYVLEGFPVVMRLEGGQLVSFSASRDDWRKIVLFGWVFPYRLVKWSVITLVAAITVVAAIRVKNRTKRS